MLVARQLRCCSVRSSSVLTALGPKFIFGLTKGKSCDKNSEGALTSTKVKLAFILYVIGEELLSKKSPNGVYNSAFNICKSNAQSPRSKRQRGVGIYLTMTNFSHNEWRDGQGRLHMSLKFYLKGAIGSGVAQLEVMEVSIADQLRK
ncbi:unnamed protein product [Protopolystoma xenopodis]|uniref:Mitochondrial import inner membrane translocase subunit Tim21 n=1 Tax=Protopolystoma xenopodis TaxID=117903 RepID=A0A448WZ68_9PLAT|nr:unnamed protein product [Protopolystoma xenopodis]